MVSNAAKSRLEMEQAIIDAAGVQAGHPEWDEFDCLANVTDACHAVLTRWAHAMFRAGWDYADKVAGRVSPDGESE